jgi:hypothetical protein
MSHLSARASSIDFAEKHKTSYCIPLWLRDEQIKIAMTKTKERIQGYAGIRDEPIAVVGFGPSLQSTWERVRDFKYIITCSGAHRFLIERGIIPTWHVEVDPREHKVTLLGDPHPDVTYLPASTCHPKYFDHLAGHKVVLWHIFASEEDALRTLPAEEYALVGGPDAGMRAMAIARFFGFTDQHVFGIDGCAGPADATHADDHPNKPKRYMDCEFPEGSGRKWRTTPALLECAKAMIHELDQLKDVTPTFYGDTLVQAIAGGYKPKDGPALPIGYRKPALISDDYRALNRQLHGENLFYGVGGGAYADTVKNLVSKLGSQSVLDYGCGKGYLAKALPFPIWEYDPAIPEKSESPRAADIVICTDVLEHIEPEHINAVLDDLARVTKKVGYYVIHTGPAGKTLPDGRNTHLIQRDRAWWESKIAKRFTVGRVMASGPLLHFVVAPRKIPKQVMKAA